MCPVCARRPQHFFRFWVCGVRFGDTMQKLAKVADKLTIVRSYQTNNGGHNIQPIVGKESLDTNIGRQTWEQLR